MVILYIPNRNNNLPYLIIMHYNNETEYPYKVNIILYGYSMIYDDLPYMVIVKYTTFNKSSLYGHILSWAGATTKIMFGVTV